MITLMDDAFRLAKDQDQGRGHACAKSRLHKLHPEAAWEQIIQAYLKACDLAEACFDYGERCRNKDMRDDQAIRDMKSRFPGFSQEIYQEALSLGYFESR